MGCLSAKQRRVRRENYEAMMNRNRRCLEEEEAKEATPSKATGSSPPSSKKLEGPKKKKAPQFVTIEQEESGEYEVAGITVDKKHDKADIEGIYEQSWTNIPQMFNISSPKKELNSISFSPNASSRASSPGIGNWKVRRAFEIWNFAVARIIKKWCVPW